MINTKKNIFTFSLFLICSIFSFGQNQNEINNDELNSVLLKLHSFNRAAMSLDDFSKDSNLSFKELKIKTERLKKEGLLENEEKLIISELGHWKVEELKKEGSWFIDNTISSGSTLDTRGIQTEDFIFSGNRIKDKSSMKVKANKSANISNNVIDDSSKVDLEIVDSIPLKEKSKKHWFYEFWNDSVWSKVIAAGIFAFIIFLLNQIKKFLFKKPKARISEESLILETLKTQQFKHGRTISGIMSDTSLSRNLIHEKLIEFQKEGLVIKKKGRKKNLWSITTKGRKHKLT